MNHRKERTRGIATTDQKPSVGFRRVTPIRRLGRIGIVALVVTYLVLAAWFYGSAFAGEVGRYQVVAGGEDSAYLVDTTSGAVWVLTHRTLATGREPVAIPYKFIQISPADRNEFLIETLKDGQAGPKDKEPVKSK
jgi:hypothetical protein